MARRADDENEDDERPVRRRKPIEDEDDDEEDLKPVRRTKRRVKPKKNTKLLIGLLVGGAAFFLMLAFTIGGWYFFIHDTPERAFNAFQRAAEKDDFGTMYDRMSNQDRREMEDFFRRADEDSLKNLKGRELYVAAQRKALQNKSATGLSYSKQLKPGKVVATDVNGDRATVTFKRDDGTMGKVNFVYQDGSWRLEFF